MTGSNWGYGEKNGPNLWGELTGCPMCDEGTKQSPINISDAKPDTEKTLGFAYDLAPLYLKMNEHSLYVHFENDSPDQIVTFNGKNYKMVQLHFHAPSEHFENDEVFPMEVHLVHKNEQGEILVVGSFIKKGAESDYIEHLFGQLPNEHSETVHDHSEVTLNPSDLLPIDKSFYNYDGSLTTPPCSEDVTWIVMKNPIELSEEQIKTFRSKVLDGNVRPVQPLNDRVITLTSPK